MSDIPSHFRDRIEAARKQQLKTLDLSNDPYEASSEQKLTSIPLQVFQLEHLESLNLTGNQITKIPPKIEQLENLKFLTLSHNKIKMLPRAIGQLKNLESLYVDVNKIAILPAEIGQLSKLAVLNLAFNDLISFSDAVGELPELATLRLSANRASRVQIPNWLQKLKKIKDLSLNYFDSPHIPEWIAQWSALQRLELDGSEITEIPEWAADLQNLTVLRFGNNHLAGVPDSFSRLQRLRTLGLDGNRISKFPPVIIELQKLSYLDMEENELAHLPATINKLQRLRFLDLAYNALTILPDTLSELTDLQYLTLDGNRLTSIPEAIYRLTNLETLKIRRGYKGTGNQITAISSKILQLDKLKHLSLSGNPMEVPPSEITEKGIGAIRDYFRQLTAEGTDHLYEAKLLIVGEGGAGKTTLAKKIQDPNYQLREEDSTRGIDVGQWHFSLDNGRTFQVNIWDFGGQEIYHATHQFFLTKRSLYVLVSDTRKEDTDFYYWLNVTELLSDGSPILIIKNEKQDRHREIDELALRGQFANLKNTLATNLADNRGLTKVVEEIRHQITQLPHVGAPLPKTWVRVREALEQNPRNYISIEEYLSICAEQGFAELKARLQLSEYLHDLGVCLHFQDDPLLKRIVILKPKWGTDAVYKVLDNPQVIRNLGRFTRDDLANIWDEPEHAALQDELLQLMMKFKLCYPLPSTSGTYIAPQLLSAKQPEYPWHEGGNLLLRYNYEFMPKGILTQLIVAMHAFIAEQQLVWKSGVVLAKHHTLAEVKEHYDRREIRIRVAGKHRKDLLVVTTHELEKIHSSYPSLKYSTLVPCNCATCRSSPEPHFYRLGVLRQFIEDRQARIQCQRSYEMVDVLGLVDDVADREQLVSAEARIKNGAGEDPGPQFLFQGTIEQVFVQQSLSGKNALIAESRGDAMARKPRDTVKAQSAWANGSFYLFAFVVVIAALGILARTVPAYVLPIILIAGVLFVPLVGALQLRMDERLAQKSFLELMKLVIGQLPLIRRVSKQQKE